MRCIEYGVNTVRAQDIASPEELRIKAAELIDTNVPAVRWACWPQAFGNTGGPIKGGVHGNAITEYQVYMFWAKGKCLLYCGGHWQWTDKFEYQQLWDKSKPYIGE